MLQEFIRETTMVMGMSRFLSRDVTGMSRFLFFWGRAESGSLVSESVMSPGAAQGQGI